VIIPEHCDGDNFSGQAVQLNSQITKVNNKTPKINYKSSKKVKDKAIKLKPKPKINNSSLTVIGLNSNPAGKKSSAKKSKLIQLLDSKKSYEI